MTFRPTRFYAPPKRLLVRLCNPNPNTQKRLHTLLTPPRHILIKLDAHILRKEDNDGRPPVRKVPQFLALDDCLAFFDGKGDGADEEGADGDEEDWVLGVFGLQLQDCAFVLREDVQISGSISSIQLARFNGGWFWRGYS